MCGCRVVDSNLDSDNNGVLDCCNECSNDIDKTVPGLLGCREVEDTGSAMNEVPDCDDECPQTLQRLRQANVAVEK